MPSSGASSKVSFPPPTPVRLPGFVRFLVYVLFLLVGFAAVPILRLSASDFVDAWLCDALAFVIGLCQAALNCLPFLNVPTDLAFSFLRYLTATVMDLTGDYMTDQASVYCIIGAVLLVIHTLIPIFAAHFVLWILSQVGGRLVSLWKGLAAFVTGGVSPPTPGPKLTDYNADKFPFGVTSGLLDSAHRTVKTYYQQLRARSRASRQNRSYLRVQRLDPSTNEPITDDVKDWDINNEVTLDSAIRVKLDLHDNKAYVSLPGAPPIPMEYEKARIVGSDPHRGASGQLYALTWFGGEQ